MLTAGMFGVAVENQKFGVAGVTIVEGPRTWIEEGTLVGRGNHETWSPLPSGGFFSLSSRSVRARRRKDFGTPPHILSRLKGHGLSSQLYKHLPLSSFQRRSSSAAYLLTPVGALPTELLLRILTYAILLHTIDDDHRGPNEIRALQDMGSVCLSWMNIVVSNKSLWGHVMASAQTAKQRFIVELLAGSSLLDVRTLGIERPRGFGRYISNARSLDIVSPGISWLHALRGRHLPCLRTLSIKGSVPHCTEHSSCAKRLCIDAPNLEHICTNRYADISSANLRSARLLSGFGSGEGASASSYEKFFNRWGGTLEEVEIDPIYHPSDQRPIQISWQDVLGGLSGGPLRVLRVLSSGSCSLPRRQNLDLANLRTCITTVPLLFATPPDLEHAEIEVSNFMALTISLHGFINTRLLNISFVTRSHGNWPWYYEHDGEEYTFDNLRSFIVSSPIDDNALYLLEACKFPRLSSMELSVDFTRCCKEVDAAEDISSLAGGDECELESQCGSSPSSEMSDMASEPVSAMACVHTVPDDSKLTGTVLWLESLGTRFSEYLLGPAMLTITTRTTVGRSFQQIVFSLVDDVREREAGTRNEIRAVGLHLAAYMDVECCQCTRNHGFGISAVHALVAVAHKEVYKLRLPLIIETISPSSPFSSGGYSSEDGATFSNGVFDTQAPDVCVKGPKFALWTPPDALQSSCPVTLARLRRDISNMPNLRVVEVDVVPSRNRVGVGLFKALVAGHQEELAHIDQVVSMAKLVDIRCVAPSMCRSMNPRDRHGRFWEELLELARLRRQLHEQGRCPVLHITLAGNFCSCGSAIEETQRVVDLRSFAIVSFDLLQDGCIHCD